MSLVSADLPSDPDALRAFALACQSQLAEATAELQAARLAVQLRTLEIEKLKFQIAKLRRMQFGRSSERVTRQIEQLELRLEELEAGEAEAISQAAREDQPLPIRQRSQPKRKKLPDHLPRQEVVHELEHDGACTCPACGGAMARLGEDLTEVLDYIPGRFRVIRHVRPKYACRYCDAITQAPGPALPTPRGRAAPGMLARLLVSKYTDHLPLYRQSQIYARDGLDLDRSTLSDWVGQAVWLLQPIVEGIAGRYLPPRRSTATTPPCRYLNPVSDVPGPGDYGCMSATTGRSVARHRRRRPTSTAPTAAANILPSILQTFEASCRPMATAGWPPSTSRGRPSRGLRQPQRSPRSPVGATAAEKSSMCGKPPSRLSPRRRSIRSPNSTSSRTRPASLRPPSGWRIAPPPSRCSMRSSPGRRRQSGNSRHDRHWPRRCATQSSGATRSPALLPTPGSNPTTTSPKTRCAASPSADATGSSPAVMPAAGVLPQCIRSCRLRN